MIQVRTRTDTPGLLQLQGAWYVARTIDEGGSQVDALSRSLLSVPTGHVHDRESLLESQQLLEELGLLTRSGGVVNPSARLLELRQLPMVPFVEALLLALLTDEPPLWLTNIRDDDDVAWELVPLEPAALLRSVFENPDRRDAFLVNVARKVDADAMAASGLEGELAVVEACREHLRAQGRADLAEEVVRVSEYDDTLGFDISSPDPEGRRHLLEAKATRSLSDQIDIYLSRNEARVGRAEPMWAIVVAQQRPVDDQRLVMSPIGWLAFCDIQDLLPQDTDGEDGIRGRWQSVKITVAASRLRARLPLDRS